MPNDQRIHRQSATAKEEDSRNSVSATSRRGEPPSRRNAAEESGSPQENRVSRQRVAIVHDWLNGMRGGEAVFEAILDLFPGADVFTLVCEPDQLSKKLREKLAARKVHTSWLNRFAFTRKRYRQLLPLLPFTIRRFNLYPYDVVISSSHCVAKGVRKHPDAFHLSYIHAPMRYMWDRFDDYFGKGRINPVLRLIAKLLRPALQSWDRASAQENNIDVLVANSQFIAQEIKRFYGRESTVIYPFANFERFSRPRNRSGFYLMVGAFAPYKRVDLAIEAFARMSLPLKIVGQGQDAQRLLELKEKLHAKNVEFLGSNVSNDQIESLYSQCKAFIFPGKEDFGITPLEAMAAGAPVIAYGEGGACETVTQETGILFSPQTIDKLCESVMDIETGRKALSEVNCRARAQFFTQERFKAEFVELYYSKLNENTSN